MVWINKSSVDEFILLGLTSNPQAQLVLFAIFLVFYLITLVGNSLIILITITENSLQTPMYFFLTNLSLIDISYSSTFGPRMLKDLISSRKTILFGECAVQMYIGLSLAYTEFILLPIMAYDRYIAICYPLHYTIIMKRSVCKRLASGAWICGFILPICLVIFIFNLSLCGNNKINHFLCEPPEMLVLACTDLFIIENVIYFLGMIILVTPITCVLVSYAKIIATILKISSSSGRRKTFSTCASHMIVVTLFYGMIMGTYMKPTSVHLPEQDKMMAVVYIVDHKTMCLVGGNDDGIVNSDI
ncbi:olfactory receptor 13F1-like [Discoglossus pictus]